MSRFHVFSLALLLAGLCGGDWVAAETPTTAPSVESAGTPATRPSRVPRTPDDAITPRPSRRFDDRNRQFRNRVASGKVDLLFLGDSITDFWPRIGEYSWLQLAQYNPADFGISGEKTEELLYRITQGELDDLHPKLVVILIGTNNIGQNPPDKTEWAAAGVAKVVSTVREKLPGSRILLLGVFPRDEKTDRKRSDVAGINKIIRNLDDGRTVHYLDIGKVFLDAEGNIPADVMPDGLHPSAKGYGLWLEAIRPSIEKLMRP